MTSFSRACLTVAVAAAAAAVLPCRATAQVVRGPAPGPRSPEMIRRNVQLGLPLTLLTAENTQDFDLLVEEHFPGFTMLPSYAKLRPFLVLVRNDAMKQIRGYAIVWLVTSPAGQQWGVFRESAVVPPAEVGYPLSHAVNPGQVRLVAPFFDIKPYEWRQLSAHPGWFEKLHSGADLPHYDNQVVTPEVDGVVYSDGSFRGPDRMRVLERYYNARDAEHDEALVIKRLVDNGASASQVAAKLRVARERGKDDQGRYMRAGYIRARRQAAIFLQRILQRSGLAYVRAEVDGMVQVMPPFQSFTRRGRWYNRRFTSDEDLGPNAKARDAGPGERL